MMGGTLAAKKMDWIVAAGSAVLNMAGSSMEPLKYIPKTSSGSLRDPIDHRLVIASGPFGSAAVATRVPLRYRFQLAPSQVPAKKTQLPTSPSGTGNMAEL